MTDEPVGPADELVAILEPWARAGQHALAAELRQVVETQAGGVARKLRPGDDEQLLEPVAFAAAARGSASEDEFELAYVGALPPRERPVELTVRADGEGRAFLPGLGFLTSLRPSAPARLTLDASSPVSYSAPGANATSLIEWRVRAAGPFLLRYPVPDLERAGASQPGALPGVEESTLASRATLTASFQRLDAVWPRLSSLIGLVTRYIVIFHGSGQNSFAKTSAHGVAFLNAALGGSEAFFIEDLAHQCGHIIFTAVWHGAEPLLSVPSDTGVDTLTGRPDHRTLEVALHGMVTQSLMVAALDKILASGADIDRDETSGRLFFALMRLGLDLRLLAPHQVFTDPGAALLRSLLGCYAVTAGEHREALLRADFSGQLYNFDYELYRARNQVAGRPDQ